MWIHSGRLSQVGWVVANHLLCSWIEVGNGYSICLNGIALMEVGIWSKKFCRQWCGCGKQHVQSRLMLRSRHSSGLSVCSFHQSFKVNAVCCTLAYDHQCFAIQAWHIHSQPQPMNREASFLPSQYNTLIVQQTSPRLTLHLKMNGTLS